MLPVSLLVPAIASGGECFRVSLLCQARLEDAQKFMPHWDMMSTEVPPGGIAESIGMKPPVHRSAIVGFLLQTVREQPQTHTGTDA